MLLVDFGEKSYKFAVAKKIGQDLEVGAWGVEDMRSLEHGAESILKKIGENSDAGPTFLSFSPGLWRAKTFYERIERQDAVLRINPAEKESILGDLSQRVRGKLTERIQKTSGILAEDVIIEKLHIQRSVIDGYEVQDIAGLHGMFLDFQILAIFTFSEYHPILDAVVKRFQDPRIFHIVEALQGFSRAKRKDGVFVDMGDASTQVIVVKDGKAAFVGQIPKGGKDFTFFLQETLRLGENTARDFKERYSAGDFSFSLREQVKKGFLDLAKELLALVQESLREVAISLPSSIYLFGGTSKIPEIQEVFQAGSFSDLAFGEEPSVSFLMPENLWTLPSFPGKTNSILTPLFLLPYANKENS